jgi:hypothetical protein
MVKFQRRVIFVVSAHLASHTQQLDQVEFSLPATTLLRNIRLEVKIQKIIFASARTVFFLSPTQVAATIHATEFHCILPVFLGLCFLS